jgi:hypothetical protein
MKSAIAAKVWMLSRVRFLHRRVCDANCQRWCLSRTAGVRIISSSTRNLAGVSDSCHGREVARPPSLTCLGARS